MFFPAAYCKLECVIPRQELQYESELLVCKLLTPLHPFCGFHVFLSSLYTVDLRDDFHLLLVQEFKVRTILIAVRALSLPLCHFP